MIHDLVPRRPRARGGPRERRGQRGSAHGRRVGRRGAAFVGHAVAVVVHTVAELLGTGMDRGILRAAVAGAVRVAVAVLVRHRVGIDPRREAAGLVDLPVTVVVDLVAADLRLHGAGRWRDVGPGVVRCVIRRIGGCAGRVPAAEVGLHAAAMGEREGREKCERSHGLAPLQV